MFFIHGLAESNSFGEIEYFASWCIASNWSFQMFSKYVGSYTYLTRIQDCFLGNLEQIYLTSF